MRQQNKEVLLEALRHGFPSDADPLLEEVLVEDLRALEPIIDEWIAEARDYYFQWTAHIGSCDLKRELPCSCGLDKAIANRRTT